MTDQTHIPPTAAVASTEPVAAKLDPGWYLSTDGVNKRWWNGDAWTEHRQTPPGWYAHPSMAGTQQYWDGENWTDHVAPGAPTPAGGVVVNVHGGRAYKTSHGFHLFMSIITVGIWIPVWIIVAIYNSSRNGR